MGGLTATGMSYWTTAFAADQEVFCTINQIPTVNGQSVIVMIRQTNPNSAGNEDGYFVIFKHDGTAARSYDYYRLDNSVGTALGANVLGPTLVNGNQLGVRMVGSTLTVYTKQGAGAWTAIDAGRTDATYNATGYIMLALTDHTTGVAVTNFGGGSVAVSGQPAMARIPRETPGLALGSVRRM
jgi:hypothetical protein